MARGKDGPSFLAATIISRPLPNQTGEGHLRDQSPSCNTLFNTRHAGLGITRPGDPFRGEHPVEFGDFCLI